MIAPCFVTGKFKNTKNTMMQMNPFYIENGLNAAGKEKSTSSLRKGMLLTETQNDK
jgi:hypothetical protein